MLAVKTAARGARRGQGLWVRGLSAVRVGEVGREAEAMRRLVTVQETVTGRRLTALGCVKGVRVNGDHVRVDLDMVVPGYPHMAAIEADCRTALQALDWVKEISFLPSSPRATGQAGSSKESLKGVKHIVAVSSCKGGVGKSTVAVNLACALASQGLAVGILDADIYGPSLPFQLAPESPVVKRSPTQPQHVLPLTSQAFPNLKMLSFGHVNPKSGAPGSGGQSAALVRGPIATKIINQLLLATEWGELDYLVVDMPPGTGDIQITLSQLASFSGAVLVTTPHPLALVDVVKGMSLFQTVDIRTLALVENMAYFRCEHGGMYHPFGKGGQAQVLRALRTLHAGDGKTAALAAIEEAILRAPYLTLPLVLPADDLDSHALTQLPAVVAAPHSQISATYQTLAKSVIEQIFASQADIDVIPSIQWDPARKGLKLRYFTSSQAFEHFLPQRVLLLADAQTGAMAAATAVEDEDVLGVEAQGRYGLAVAWRRQTKIFPFDVLRQIAQDMAAAAEP